MYFCHRGEANRSQNPVKCSNFEAQRIAETKATYSLTWLGKFEQLMGELTTSRFILPEPRILQLRSSAHAAHRTPTTPSDLLRLRPPCPTRSLDTPIPLLLR